MKTERQGDMPEGQGFGSSGRWKTFLTAAIFIIVGMILLGKNFGIVDPEWVQVICSWQMLLVVIGMAILFKRQYTAGAILIGIGILFLVPLFVDRQLWGNVWPVVFILIGVILLFKRKSSYSYIPRRAEIKCECTYDEYLSDDGFLISENTFGAVQQVVLNPIFRGGRLKCVFGSTVVDLRRTTLEKRETYIDVECKFGGIEIFVPSDWNIQTQMKCTFGGSDDKRYPLMSAANPDHRVIIRGKVTFGGIEFKN